MGGPGCEPRGHAAGRTCLTTGWSKPSRAATATTTSHAQRPPPAAAGDAGADQGGQDVCGSADCKTGAPVGESRDGAPVETRDATCGCGRLGPLPALAAALGTR